MSSVTWTDEGYDQLADIYVTTPAPDRNDLVSVVSRIERILTENAQFEGESREGNQRVYIHSPLAVTYALISYGPVLIMRVRSSRPRRKDG